MINRKQISDMISDSLSGINYPSRPERLYSPISYTLESGGKRLRPMLLLAACRASGGDLEKARWQAVGIEMFHNFTLLHDDVMDNADLRRGRPTVYRKWDGNTAILSGDAMLTMSMQFMARCEPEYVGDVIGVFNSTAMEVYEGQQYDMDFELRSDVGIKEYLEMIRLKTSVLLGCACKIGAIIASADTGVQEAFYNYGINLGLAFQLQDDWLDTFGDPLVFGKEIGGDIVNGKKTLLLISALESERAGELREIFSLCMSPEEKIARVKAIYGDLHIGDRCRELIRYYVDRAINELDKIVLDAGDRDFFESLALKSVDRNY